MYLTRKKSLLLAFVMIAIFFAAGIALVHKQRRPTPLAATGAPLPEAQPNAAASPAPAGAAQFVLHEFHRSETKNGRKLWEVRAAEGQYVPETSKAELSTARLWFYKKNGDTIELQAAKASLGFKDAGLEQAALSQGVKLVLNQQLTLTTDSAEYTHNPQIVHAPGEVRIKGEMIEITGEDLRADIDKREATIARNVESIITPKKKNRPKHE